MKCPFLLALLALAAALPSAFAGEPAIVSVTVVSPTGSLQNVIEQNVSLKSRQYVKLAPQIDGQLSVLHVHKGQTVAQGDLLAELDHQESDAALQSAKAAVAAAQARAEQARSQAANAKSELSRYQKLRESGFSTQQELEAKKTAWLSASSSEKAAAAAVTQAQAQLAEQQVRRDKAFLKAPFSGTVLNDFDLAPGATVGKATPVVELSDLTHLKGTLSVPESRRYDIDLGEPVKVKVDALPNDVFSGKIAFISDSVDPNTRTVPVEVHLDATGSASRLRPGMFGRAQIILKSAENAFILPRSALTTDETGTWVIVAADGVAHRKKVSTGMTSGDKVEITSGLEQGDQVITFGGSGLTEGQPVKILSSSSN